MAGRNPDPPALRLLKNDKAHQHRYADRDEPIPSETGAVAPNSLSESAKKYFNEFVARVEEMYPCSETDSYVITLYANNHEQLLYLEDLLRNEGLTYTTSNRLGELMIKSRPEVQIHKQCKDFELRILCEFGLTPSARARVPYKPQSKKKNAFADLDETG